MIMRSTGNAQHTSEHMYAVIKSGGKQYRVEQDRTLQVDRLEGNVGDTIEITDVLALVGGNEPKFGAPFISGAKVTAEIIEHLKGDKILIFKKRRRKNYRRKNGYRHSYTTLKITGIAA